MILGIGNPDRYDTDTLPYYFDQSGSNDAGSPAPVPGVRPDGYGGRPALTGIGGHAFVGLYPRRPDINPGSKFKGYMGGRYLFESFPAEPKFLHAFVTTGGQIQVMSVLNPDGTLSIYRGFYEEEIKGPTAVALNTDTFYRLGFTATMDPTVGEAAIWDDETKRLQCSTKNTEAFPNFGWGGIVYGLPENCALSHYYYGDVYGHQPNLLPSLFVQNQIVDSNGAFTDWSPTSGTVPSVLNVAPPDFVQRIQANADLQKFSQAMDPVPSLSTIYATQTTALVRNVGAPNASHRATLEKDGIGDDGFIVGDNLAPTPIGTDWVAVRRIDWGDPSTGGGWTRDGVNAMRFGGQVRDAA